MAKFKIPHTLVLMMYLMLAALVLTWIIPAGSFDRVENAAGQTVVLQGTFATIDDQTGVSR